mmetsp:Transcript_7165/g.10148  ORF Transcript_7165/g.10148 Transcript_7165/m.10148 type:complete len:102 (+) Transcript_7165:222-527(+)
MQVLVSVQTVQQDLILPLARAFVPHVLRGLTQMYAVNSVPSVLLGSTQRQEHSVAAVVQQDFIPMKARLPARYVRQAHTLQVGGVHHVSSVPLGHMGRSPA